MKLPATISLLVFILTSIPAWGNEINRPEGWVTCSSIYSAGDYDVTGGADGSLIVLRSTGSDMRDIIVKAVNTHDIIVFDGKNGDFEVSSSISLQSLNGRTLIGVNGACLRTAYSVPQEVREMLDELNVNSLSQHAGDNLGGTLSNGVYVAEQCELTIRQSLIDRYGDTKEPYRNSGVFIFNGCSNFILRNLDFVGPGSLDVGGADLLTFNACDHVWVDHCRFTDGLDGNLDIVNNSDFVTVSDTRFRYTEKSYNHPLSNLNSGTAITDGSPQKNNISWIRCFWDEGCKGRMPLTGFGIHHLLNCYWDCTKGTCIDAHDQSKLLIENSFFTSKISRALAERDENVLYEWRGSVWQGKASLQSNATINVPYNYTAADVLTVPTIIKDAGPTLTDPYSKVLSSSPSDIDFGKIYASHPVNGKFNLSAFGSKTPSSITLTAPEGIQLSIDPSKGYFSSLIIEATDENLLQADIYIRASFNHSGKNDLSIEVSMPDQTFKIPVKADVTGLEGERQEVTLIWPLNNGASSETKAKATLPEAFSNASFSIGGKIHIHSSLNIGNSQTFTLFNPTEAISKVADDECCIVFDVITAPGYIFIPKELKLNASRIGTDMCYLDIECYRDSGTPQKLISGFQPHRSSNTPSYSNIELPLANAGVGNSLRIKTYLYNMLATKQLALNDITIEGDVYVSNQSAITSTLSDEEIAKTEYYDLLGRRIEHPQDGRIYLMRDGAGRSKIIINAAR